MLEKQLILGLPKVEVDPRLPSEALWQFHTLKQLLTLQVQPLTPKVSLLIHQLTPTKVHTRSHATTHCQKV